MQTSSPLSVEFPNTPPDTSLVPGSVSGWLTRAETLRTAPQYWLITLAKRTDSVSEDRT
ncbi:MAG: hypothetical protein ACXACI_06325 [Candidatus Hodarchaeales archaeon]|jgi:hypothetical protein